MNKLNEKLEYAEKYCQEKGERFTQKRKTVLLALLESGKAISAYEIVDYCKQHFDKVLPAMSVYRILDFLQEQGLAHKLGTANKFVACSDIICEHDNVFSQFLICDNCQNVDEVSVVDPKILENIQAGIDKLGFRLTSRQLEINGICSKCLSD